MTRAIDLAIECGIKYFLCPEGTTEMHGFDREVEAFALRVAQKERDRCITRLLELVPMTDPDLTTDYLREELAK